MTSALPPQSPSSARRERQKAETRQRILDAARELFVTDGVEATTMRAIAARIEYTPTAIYHHFKDKDALLEELCLVDFLALAAALQRIGRIEDPIERVRRMGLAYADFAFDNQSQYQFMFMTVRHHPGEEAKKTKGNPEQDAYAFLMSSLAEGIAQNRFRPEFTDAEEMAQMYWGALHGVISLWMNHCADEWINWREPRETIRSSIDVLFRGTLRTSPP
jgi:AcrR family transcriptional regulator